MLFKPFTRASGIAASLLQLPIYSAKSSVSGDRLAWSCVVLTPSWITCVLCAAPWWTIIAKYWIASPKETRRLLRCVSPVSMWLRSEVTSPPESRFTGWEPRYSDLKGRVSPSYGSWATSLAWTPSFRATLKQSEAAGDNAGRRLVQYRELLNT